MTDVPWWLAAFALLALPAAGWFLHAGYVRRRHGRRVRILVQRAHDRGRAAGESWARSTLTLTLGHAPRQPGHAGHPRQAATAPPHTDDWPHTDDRSTP